MSSIRIDRSLLDRHIHELNRVIDAHAGGIELVAISESGEVDLKFTGMCTGCPYRPLTMAGTIRRTLLSVPGVTEVRAEGSRISAEAEQRLANLLEASPSRRMRLRPGPTLRAGNEHASEGQVH